MMQQTKQFIEEKHLKIWRWDTLNKHITVENKK